MSLASMSKWWYMYPGDHWNLQVSVPRGIQRLQLRRSVADNKHVSSVAAQSRQPFFSPLDFCCR